MNNSHDKYSFELTSELNNSIKNFSELHNISYEASLNIIIKEAIEFIDNYQNKNLASKMDIAIKNYIEGCGALEVMLRDNIKLKDKNNSLLEVIDFLSNENSRLIKELNEMLSK